MTRLTAFLRDQFQLLVAGIGIVMFAVGWLLVYPPLALILPGSILTTLAVAGAMREARVERRT